MDGCLFHNCAKTTKYCTVVYTNAMKLDNWNSEKYFHKVQSHADKTMLDQLLLKCKNLNRCSLLKLTRQLRKGSMYVHEICTDT